MALSHEEYTKLLNSLKNQWQFITILEDYKQAGIKPDLTYLYKEKNGNAFTLMHHVTAMLSWYPLDQKNEDYFMYLINYDTTWTKQDILNFLNEDGCPPIFAFVHSQKLNGIRFARLCGAKINHRDKRGLTILHHAVIYLNNELIRFLVTECKMNVNDPEGPFPPILFINPREAMKRKRYKQLGENWNGNEKIIETLRVLICELNAEVNCIYSEYSLLGILLSQEFLEVIQWLLDNVQHINRNIKDESERTPIFYADTIMAFEFARDRRLGSVNDIMDNGNTILHDMVIKNKPFELIRHAIETYDLPLTAKNMDGMTVIDLAKDAKDSKIIKYLYELTKND